MSYFNQAYQKVFLGNKPTTANANQTEGFITTAGIGTQKLSLNTGSASTTYGVGSWGLFDPTTWQSVTTASLSTSTKGLVLAAAAPQTSDTIGGNSFHGGYLESRKSQVIYPELIDKFMRIDPCTARQHTIHIGKTKYTNTLSPTQSNCSFGFVCGEEYTLRLEVRGIPALNFMQHQIYELLHYDGGCCAADAPAEPIDGTLVMIAWANQIINSPQLKDFITPIVYSEAGVAHYPPGTAGGVYTWDHYVSPGHTTNAFAGMRLQGSYVDTSFGNCSFSPTDYYGKVPIEIQATMVDFNGDPCAFTGICVNTECLPQAANGLGETVLRDLIQSERYNQVGFADDVRMREIEQASLLFDAIDRTDSYSRYVITHRVKRLNNPGSNYSVESYDEHIIVVDSNPTFETLMAAWLGNAKNPVTLETTSCGSCSTLTP